MEKRPVLEAVFILDASGSMHSLTEDTIGGFNALLAEQKQKAEGGRVLVTTVTFNANSRTIHDRIDVNSVPELTEADYRAYGSTALLDAMGDTIRHIETIHKYARPEDLPQKTLFMITTDGLENASRKYGSDEIKKMVKEKQKEDGWEFIFVAANIDAVETGARYGIDEKYVAPYLNDSRGNRKKFAAMSYAMDSFMTGGKVCEDWAAELKADVDKRS